MRIIIFLSMLFCFILSAKPVLAQEIVCPKVSQDQEENKTEARRYFNMGSVYYKMKEYDKSAASFVCVIQLVPYSLTARYQLARSYDYLGRYSLAKEQYNWVMLDPSEEAKALKPEVEKRLEEIRDLPDEKKSGEKEPETKSPETSTPGISPDTSVPEEEPVDKGKSGQNAQPGLHKAPEQKAVEKVKPGQPDPERGPAEIPGTDPAAIKKEQPPALMGRWWFWAGVGSVAVFTGATVVLGLQAKRNMDLWENEQYWEDRKTAIRYRTLTDIALSGVVLSAGTLAFGVWRHRSSGTTVSGKITGSMGIVPSCGNEGCMFTFSLGF